MTLDKTKLQKLLWAEAASFRADCADWKRNTEALQEFLGEKTLEEVALELLAENEALRKDAQCVDDLSALVRQLVHRLRQAAPDNDLPAKALDYLKRKGLQGRPLRNEHDDAAEREAQKIYEGWARQDGFVPWVPGGNSLKQDEARRLACSAMGKAVQP